MNIEMIKWILFFLILISIQYTLNQILVEIRRLRRKMQDWEERKWINEKRKNPLS